MLWRELNRWLEEHDGEHGLPTANPLDRRVHIGYPLSQALIRENDRRLLPGSGFTIEPGLYFDDFGVRTEINMIVREHDAAVTGPLQTEILTLV